MDRNFATLRHDYLQSQATRFPLRPRAQDRSVGCYLMLLQQSWRSRPGVGRVRGIVELKSRQS